MGLVFLPFALVFFVICLMNFTIMTFLFGLIMVLTCMGIACDEKRPWF